jgi:uncharacterized protein YbcI
VARAALAKKEKYVMNKHDSTDVEQIAEVVAAFQEQSTGHKPETVTVVLSEDTLVITMHEALSPAEKALAKIADGAARVQEFHRRLFATSSETLRNEIKRITGRTIREAAAKFESTSDSIAHAFATGTMVQVFLLAPNASAKQ